MDVEDQTETDTSASDKSEQFNGEMDAEEQIETDNSASGSIDGLEACIKDCDDKLYKCKVISEKIQLEKDNLDQRNKELHLELENNKKKGKEIHVKKEVHESKIQKTQDLKNEVNALLLLMRTDKSHSFLVWAKPKIDEFKGRFKEIDKEDPSITISFQDILMASTSKQKHKEKDAGSLQKASVLSNSQRTLPPWLKRFPYVSKNDHQGDFREYWQLPVVKCIFKRINKGELSYKNAAAYMGVQPATLSARHKQYKNKNIRPKN